MSRPTRPRASERLRSSGGHQHAWSRAPGYARLAQKQARFDHLTLPVTNWVRLREWYGELGIEVAKSTVEKVPGAPIHAAVANVADVPRQPCEGLVSIDFFTVATVRFEILLVLVILAHDRRRVQHVNITAHPTAEWTAQQVVEAFPWETAPRYLLRDRDGVYGGDFRTRVAALGIEEVLSAPRSPWQSPYVERVIGSIRREFLDNVV
jgi:putative transposase